MIIIYWTVPWLYHYVRGPPLLGGLYPEAIAIYDGGADGMGTPGGQCLYKSEQVSGRL